MVYISHLLQRALKTRINTCNAMQCRAGTTTRFDSAQDSTAQDARTAQPREHHSRTRLAIAMQTNARYSKLRRRAHHPPNQRSRLGNLLSTQHGRPAPTHQPRKMTDSTPP